MQIRPYLFFQGRCDEAIAFYEKALGAKRVMLMRFKDNPDPQAPVPAALAEKVMHACIEIAGNSILLSDGHGAEGPNFRDFALTLSFPDAAAVDRAFAALEDGGAVAQPLQKTFFSARFGMVRDRFGLMWIVLVD